MVPTGILLTWFVRSPDILAPGITPVTAGEKDSKIQSKRQEPFKIVFV